jgi:hypothetical protein
VLERVLKPLEDRGSQPKPRPDFLHVKKGKVGIKAEPQNFKDIEDFAAL